jgi:hypothetical protein
VATRKSWLFGEDKDIKWVTIVSKGFLDEAIVGWVVDRGVEYTVELEDMALVIEFILIATTAGNFDHNVNPLFCVHIVPFLACYSLLRAVHPPSPPYGQSRPT